MKYVIKYDNLYISNIHLDEYDSEFIIKFTSIKDNAQRFNKDIIDNILNIIRLYFEVIVEESSDKDE